MGLSKLIRTQPEDAMIVTDFADFCLVTYMLVDDLWDALPAALKPRGEQSDCSNSELLTMVLVEECMWSCIGLVDSRGFVSAQFIGECPNVEYYACCPGLISEEDDATRRDGRSAAACQGEAYPILMSGTLPSLCQSRVVIPLP